MRLAAFATFGAICLGQAGHWEGKISVPQRELPFSVDFAKNAAGAWIGSITVNRSTSVDVPLSNISLEGSGIRFKAYLPEPSSFAGALSADGASISGSATNAQGDAPFELTRKGEANVKVPPASSPLAKDFAGTWEGTLSVQGQTLRLGLRLAADAEGKASGVFIAYDQNTLEIPITTVTIEGKEIRLESRPVSGLYKGTLGENGEISGQWGQGQMTAPVVFKRKP